MVGARKRNCALPGRTHRDMYAAHRNSMPVFCNLDVPSHSRTSVVPVACVNYLLRARGDVGSWQLVALFQADVTDRLLALNRCIQDTAPLPACLTYFTYCHPTNQQIQHWWQIGTCHKIGWRTLASSLRLILFWLETASAALHQQQQSVISSPYIPASPDSRAWYFHETNRDYTAHQWSWMYLSVSIFAQIPTYTYWFISNYQAKNTYI